MAAGWMLGGFLAVLMHKAHLIFYSKIYLCWLFINNGYCMSCHQMVLIGEMIYRYIGMLAMYGIISKIQDF